MSFKIGRFFYFLISIIVGLFFLLLGIVAMAIPVSETMRRIVISLINNQTYLFLLFGLGFFIVGLSIIISAFIRKKRRYNHIQINGGEVTIDEAVVQQYLQAYWKEHFQVPIPSTVTIKKHAIQIVADFPYLPIEEQRTFLERLQKDFVHLFGKTLGYPYEVDLMASFGNGKRE